jgi:integrase
MANRHGRAISKEDRAALLAALARHRPHDFEALRTRALVHLAWGSGLRLAECIALDVGQLVEWRGAVPHIRTSSYLRVEQAKGSRHDPAHGWSSAGQFVITPPAAKALRAYLREADTRGWLKRNEGPVFVSYKPRRAGEHTRLTPRGARHSWYRLQRRAGLHSPWYRFHDLRHDAISRFSEACNGDVFRVARFARLDTRTAARYVHTSWTTITEIAALASR